MPIRGAHGRRELAGGLVGVDDVLDAEILEIRRLLGARAERHDRGARRCHVAVLRRVTRHLAARRNAEHHDVGRLGAIERRASQVGLQHAHVALVPEQIGDDCAKRFVVTGHVYHDHDNSLSSDVFDVQRRPSSAVPVSAARQKSR